MFHHISFAVAVLASSFVLSTQALADSLVSVTPDKAVFESQPIGRPLSITQRYVPSATATDPRTLDLLVTEPTSISAEQETNAAGIADITLSGRGAARMAIDNLSADRKLIVVSNLP